jgi:NAD(P)-dependent dehydrogenase (short-subunit alcohol dehydrogenase family)
MTVQDSKTFAGKVVVITGASKGIGAATARRFGAALRRGGRVGGAGRPR